MGERKVKEIKKGIRLAIGQMLKLFAASAGISFSRFYKLMATCLVDEANPSIASDTVKRYTNRGIPQKLSYTRLSAVIEQMYQSYIKEETLEDEKRLVAEKAHSAYYPEYLFITHKLYDMMKLLDELEPFLKIDFQMQLVLLSFMKGVLFDDDKAPDQKTLVLLRESLQRFPPKFQK